MEGGGNDRAVSCVGPVNDGAPTNARARLRKRSLPPRIASRAGGKILLGGLR
jgi:hypothetical protein